MMKKIIIVLQLLLITGCSKEVSLDKNFKIFLISYQKKFPIPNKKKQKDNRLKIYVYVVSFSKEEGDTLFTITRSSSGIVQNTKGFGIYQDDELKPTFIIDNNKLCSQFVLKKINVISNNFYWREKQFPESFTPLYTYSINKKVINLVKIDTIWKHWEF